jgi:hypothetical protein
MTNSTEDDEDNAFFVMPNLFRHLIFLTLKQVQGDGGRYSGLLIAPKKRFSQNIS